MDKQTLYNWCAAYPEFKQAKNIGTEASRKKIEGMLMRCAKTGRGNVIASIFLLKNKFPNEWRDRKEIDIQTEEVKENLTLDEQIARVELMRSQLLQIKAGQDTKTIEV